MSRTAFFGSPESAVPVLQALADGSDLRLVVTRPDRVRGRGSRRTPTPVKARATELGIEVAEPSSKAELGPLLAERGLDLVVVAAYGMIIPAAVLSMPRLGMINLHYSLLPRWRGAAPVERAILAGDTRTGVTIMQMDAGLDTGPMLATWETAIGADETGGALTARLAGAAGELLVARLPQILAGALKPIPQPEDGATYASMLSPAEAVLDPAAPAATLAAAIRAFDPRPGARLHRDGEPFKVFAPIPVREIDLPPGRLDVMAGILVMGTGTVPIGLGEVQPAGKRRMPGTDWARGIPGDLGTLT